VSAKHYTYFLELRHDKVLRIYLPGTSLNNGEKEGRGMEALALN
jgi:hypothetical protein